MTVESYLHQGKKWAARQLADPRVRRAGEVLGSCGRGFLLSAASLGNAFQPVAMGCVMARSGRDSLLTALGSAGGYLFFWGAAGRQGVLWSVLAALAALVPGKDRLFGEQKLLPAALCACFAAVSGLIFQILGADVAPGIYFLRLAVAGASGALFVLLRQRGDPVLRWIHQGVWVLALAQVAPFGFPGVGCAAAGALALTQAFPGAAVAGLALDLARISPVSMTAVVCLIWMARLIPGLPRWARALLPGAAWLLVMVLCGAVQLQLLPGWLLGGLVACFLPDQPEAAPRRGETGIAQVRLELMAGVLSRSRLLLMDFREVPIDREAILARARERACGSCPNRRACHAPQKLPEELLRRPLVENTSLPFPCKKSGRMILELRRSQEQYRFLRGSRDRQREYREAVSQQYLFLSEYLQELADGLPRRDRKLRHRFLPEAAVATVGREAENGDRCMHFRGPGARYYLLLCDGMGTGIGAAAEGEEAAGLLYRMLTAGFPAEHALRSLNSLLLLRGRSGAVTMDLAEVHLDTGSVTVYKWGAASSCLLRGNFAEKIGTAGPPPGIGITDDRETVQRLSLRRGEVLILHSDGVDGEEVRRCAAREPGLPPGEMAAMLLETGAAGAADDATVAVIRLRPLLST